MITPPLPPGDFDSAGAGERLITIVGTNVQAHLAEYMLQCCVQSYGGQNYKTPEAILPKRRKLQVNPSSDYTTYAPPGTEPMAMTDPTMGHW